MTPRGALAAPALPAAACGAGPTTDAGLAPSPPGSVISPFAPGPVASPSPPGSVISPSSPRAGPRPSSVPTGRRRSAARRCGAPPDLERWRIVAEGPVWVMPGRDDRVPLDAAIHPVKRIR
ncbi:hypothetical protein ACIBKY_14230 [Nonomuraea sp. NPDC050394]|uniref:hypothetical protein n=1 Tax=Nonomuraea sp. NPDC050394 TaxID=3364363 RepID=UPI0037A21587